jgi:regulation of enolase protein 1 (concanavalin A-like superfamily)
MKDLSVVLAILGSILVSGATEPFPELNSSDIGSPELAGSIDTNATGSLIMTGSGAGIGNRDDQGHFAWTTIEGDFDWAVRVESLWSPDLFGRAGLMARESLAGGSRFAGVFATPNVGGIAFQTRDTTGANGRQFGGAPANYPDVWLRLRREGNVFTGATSDDGLNWAQLESAAIIMPATVEVGLAVTSWRANERATAVFGNLGVAEGELGLPSTPVVELPGPSSRRTGLVISEVMYNPARRLDGRDLEFIELFNSRSLYEDISGYRLSGAVEFTIPQGTILEAGGFLVIARAPQDMQAVHGLTNVLGNYSGRLGGSGTVRLHSRNGSVLIEARYDSEERWPAAADGAGHSLVLARPSYGERNIEAWAASRFKGGSPGRWDGYVRDRFSPVKINELLARTQRPALDYIELYNHSNEPVDLSGVFLSDSPFTNRFRIPNGTILPARGFLTFDETALGFALSAAGETVYLTAPDDSRVIDAVRFGGQAMGVSYGRSPDGSPNFRSLAQPTPGASNSAALASDIVFNEIMFNPITRGDEDQYIELHNRSAVAVDLAGWQLTAGIRFVFPEGVVVPGGGYVVVAKNAARMLSNYPNLSAANCVGNFQGRLSGKGERLVLARPDVVSSTDRDGQAVTSTNWITVSELSYVDGGRWGSWSDAGGSSLELIDPRADPTLAANWADSDESEKGQWTTIEHTGILDHGITSYGLNQVQIFLLGVGECLVDDVEVIGPGGTNFLTNGSFENGLTGWTPQGSHRDSTIAPGMGIAGSQCLHIRAQSRGDPGANRIRAIVPPGLREGQQVTLRAKVRWLKGFPEFLIRLRGNHLEAAGRLDTSHRLGTPGLPNSQVVPNAPPAIYDVVHTPILPKAGQPVVVTARINDPDGIGAFVLRYRIDPSKDVTEVMMRDDGTGGDSVAGDGVFSATIPGQPLNALVAFHLGAEDAAATPSAGTFPVKAPAQECLVRFGEVQPGGSFGTYRIWMTQEVRARWTSRESLNNAPLDVTFVYGNQRVIYNAGSLYVGSPFVSSGYNGPTGTLCGYAVRFPEDDRFLGITDMKLDWPTRDPSLQLEQVAYWIADQLGIPSNHRRFVHLYVNGVRRGVIYEDSQQPNSDMVAQYFPDDSDGEIYKIDDWFEFDNTATGFANRDATLQNFTTTGGEKKLARYRWNWRKRAVKESASDYRSLFALVDATRNIGMEEATRNLEAIMDVEEWLRTIALEHIVGNWDSFGYRRGKNMFAYKPERGKWNLLMWDIDFVLGAGSDPPNSYLFSTIDPTISQMFFHPPFRRTYYRALYDAANGPLQTSNFTPVLVGNHAALWANGLTPTFPGVGSNYMTARMRHINQELAQVNRPFSLAQTNPVVSTPLNVFVLEGTAPIQAREIQFNGIAYPITWLTETRWRVRLPLEAATNHIEIVALDTLGQPISGGNAAIEVRYTGTVESPRGRLVFNELMHHPPAPGAEYIELHNTSISVTFDLSNWRISGLAYTFPPGSTIAPGAFLVLAKDRTRFAEAYGRSIVPLDVFPGTLSPTGETLRLIKPGATPDEDMVVAELAYSSQMPWPQAANQGGIALQLRDPFQSQNRVGNWAARTAAADSEWGFASVTGPANSSRLLLYLSGMPPVRDTSTIEGGWDGEVDFGEGKAAFRVEFSPLPPQEWQGVFIFEAGDETHRFPLSQVQFDGRVLTFGLGSEGPPEFRFTLSADGSSMTGTYREPGQPMIWSATLRRLNPGGDVFIDDLRLVHGAVAGAGPNLVQNGDFELPLEGVWNAGSSHSSTTISETASHSGSSSLHLVATAGGHDSSTAVWQDLDTIEPGETYTLSYWVRRGSSGSAVVVRLEDWSLTSVQDLKPAPTLPIAFTPGRVNSTFERLPDLPHLWLNELQPVNLSGVTDRFGERSPWVELLNADAVPVQLADYVLADAYLNPALWQFPASAQLAPGEFKLVWLDGDAGKTIETDWHASFRASPSSGTLVLARWLGDELQIVDYLEYDNLAGDSSIGWASDGVANQRQVFAQPTPLASNAAAPGASVFINEWMASNGSTLADPADGKFEDWFELFNPGNSPVDLTGYTLSDSVLNPSKFIIPPGTIVPARGYLLLWADGEPEQNQAGGDLHVNFKLSIEGEVIILSAPNGTQVDFIAFGPQTRDVSEGRWPDGAPPPFQRFTRPTPRSANALFSELRLGDIRWTVEGELLIAWPSAAGQQFRLQFKNNLDDSTWTDIDPPIIATGPETAVTINDSADGPHRFFRVRLVER